MEVILTALLAGAAAASKDVATQAVKDGYNRLKELVRSKLGGATPAAVALDQVESAPESEAWLKALKKELEKARVDLDDRIVDQAKALQAALREAGIETGSRYQAKLEGDGAIAQGPGAVAAGKGGVAVGGDVSGGIRLGGGDGGEKEREE